MCEDGFSASLSYRFPFWSRKDWNRHMVCRICFINAEIFRIRIIEKHTFHYATTHSDSTIRFTMLRILQIVVFVSIDSVYFNFRMLDIFSKEANRSGSITVTIVRYNQSHICDRLKRSTSHALHNRELVHTNEAIFSFSSSDVFWLNQTNEIFSTFTVLSVWIDVSVTLLYGVYW